jgi:hypothetical protein
VDVAGAQDAPKQKITIARRGNYDEDEEDDESDGSCGDSDSD